MSAGASSWHGRMPYYSTDSPDASWGAWSAPRAQEHNWHPEAENLMDRMMRIIKDEDIKWPSGRYNHCHQGPVVDVENTTHWIRHACATHAPAPECIAKCREIWDSSAAGPEVPPPPWMYLVDKPRPLEGYAGQTQMKGWIPVLRHDLGCAIAAEREFLNLLHKPQYGYNEACKILYKALKDKEKKHGDPWDDRWQWDRRHKDPNNWTGYFITNSKDSIEALENWKTFRTLKRADGKPGYYSAEDAAFAIKGRGKGGFGAPIMGPGKKGDPPPDAGLKTFCDGAARR